MSLERTIKHASELAVAHRAATYVTVLAGYFLYCYNFVVLDYVRPYLVSEIGFSVLQTGWIYSAGTVGVTVGAMVWASVVTRLGRRGAAVGIASAIGLTAALQALSNDFATWIGARALLSAALGGYYVVATSLVVALFPPTVRSTLIAVNSATYAVSNIAVGVLGAALGDTHWRALLWIAALPLPLAALLGLAIPRDRTYHAYDVSGTNEETSERVGWAVMLSKKWRWRTAGCVLLSGIDFNAYQFFFSFVTLYAKTVRHLGAEAMGSIVAVISTGSLIGGFGWAILSDRRGRRIPLAGYLIAAAAIIAFLLPNASPAFLGSAGFVFGVGLACTASWGAWFTEMFPTRLQAYGASLFHTGHVLALASPLAAATVADKLGLPAAMRLAACVYLLGAVVWYLLPETLGRHRADAERQSVASHLLSKQT